MSCDSPPLTPFQPARRRHTEIESIMGKRTYTALSMCIERRGHVRERGRRIDAGERTFIDSIMDVKRRRWVGTHTGGWMTEVEEWVEVEGAQHNWVNDLWCELLGSKWGDKLKQETEWKEWRLEEKRKSSIVLVSCLRGTANYNSSLCGMKNSKRDFFVLFCFGVFSHISQWADCCKSVHPSVGLSVCQSVSADCRPEQRWTMAATVVRVCQKKPGR